ncbi:MAG: carboxylate-amine ligase [Bacteroidia bacterium]|nr:carboxylate-amine ligase [Bacteroidia bacterium]
MSHLSLSESALISKIKEDAAFDLLQERFTQKFHEIFLDDLAEKTVVIIPSLTLDKEILKSVKGVVHYEERLLCMLLLLRMPRTRVIYITSVPIDNSIIDYYLHLLPGITGYHARQRLTLLSCYDASEISLTEKILARPRLIKRIREYIRFPEMAHMATFNVTNYEKQLALQLDIPVFGCNPDLWYLGTKSGSREIFKKLGLQVPEGYENLKNEKEIAFALALLKLKYPDAQKAVVKMNDGFSGDGNAIFYYRDIGATDENLGEVILKRMPDYLKIVAAHSLTYEQYMQKFCSMGGIVEAFIQSERTESPSVQCRINPVGTPDVVSTHDQLLGGESGQVYLGASFPADPAYSKEIGEIGHKIAEELQRRGAIGRFAVDFMSVKEGAEWIHYAIEINLRKGGTTHPYIMLQFLTDGKYDRESGFYTMPNGQRRTYFATDNVVNEKYKGLTPHDLIDIAMYHRILYDGARQTGVMFHMIGALSQHGKLGMVCIGASLEEAKDYYLKTITVLNRECGVE